MFKYDQDQDRFVPDRHGDPYSFYSVHHNILSRQCVCSSDYNFNESDFLEPFECERQREKQRRNFCHLQSYMSLEPGGGHLLHRSPSNGLNENEYRHHLTYGTQFADSAWPIRMVRQRLSARKSINTNRTFAADLLLDMPNLSNDWMTKILDWSSTGYLTAAIESSVHLWSGRTQSVQYTINASVGNDAAADETAHAAIVCLKWDAQGEKLAYSFTVDRPQGGTPGTWREYDVRMDVSAADERYASPAADERYASPAPDERYASPATDERYASPATDERYASPAADEWNASPADGRSSLMNTSSETMMLLNESAGKTNYIKIWILNGHKEGSNSQQKTSTCGCVMNQFNECCVCVMDWLANGRMLVTGCTKSTVTFFRYDYCRSELIKIRVIYGSEPSSVISCLHVSQDKFSRHLAVASLSLKECVLKVWRIEDPPENLHGKQRCSSISLTECLVDRYGSKHGGCTRWIIKALAWHPWKHSLMCYAVTSINVAPLIAICTASPSWLVLANACSGQVLKRVEQTAYNSCPTVKILSVDTHSMTFSRLTGELLVSMTSAYRIKRKSNSSIMEKHSVVVMHALNRIVETLNSSPTDKGLFFTWSSDGSRIALTSSDESLRIWNFWPTTAVQRNPDPSPRHYTSSATSPNASVQVTYDGHYTNNREIIKLNRYQSKQPAMSELSLDAARIIK